MLGNLHIVTRHKTLFLAFATIALLAGNSTDADCATDHVHIQGDQVKAQFSVEIADDPAERAVGLMNRTSMPRSAGMLFIFEKVGPVSFWMRNTLIPLDILYFDENGVLLNIAHMATPHDETALPSDGNAKYVLEINGGLAKRLRIKPGSQLLHADLKKFGSSSICAD